LARDDSARDWARRLTAPEGAALPTAADARPLEQWLALAWAVKDECQAAWTEEPPRTQRCAQVLAQLQQQVDHPEVAAAAAWCDGLALLAQGRMDDALVRLDDAGRTLQTLGEAQRAAQSQIPKVIALSMLGRHDEALACGEQTRTRLLAAGDEFARAGEPTPSIAADIGLAGALTWQFEFDEALRLYERSAMRVRARGLSALQGAIDTNRGRLELHRGRFEPALRALESALREAEADGMPQDVAEARRDMGDTYLALNLLPEAVALYDQTIESCQALDAPVERAWAQTQRALALARQGDARLAASALDEARGLFEAADNRVGMALADLRAATLALQRGQPGPALQGAEAAAAALTEAGVEGWRWEAELVAADALAAATSPTPPSRATGMRSTTRVICPSCAPSATPGWASCCNTKATRPAHARNSGWRCATPSCSAPRCRATSSAPPTVPTNSALTTR
jgi:tetratricopeptide (TPR) repeat protein